MIGALAINPESPFYGDLVLRTSGFHMPPYRRDTARLAFEMEAAPSVVAKMNANASKLCQFLKKHPAVDHIYCAGCSDHIEEISKGEGAVGAVISVELKGSMQKFYDAVKIIKGPSFGTRYTLLCPFLYLAHYDLVTTDEGRAFLADVGLKPDLIRISVGEEPYEEIEAAVNGALCASI
jgi:cystathionine gamma-synthase